MDPERMAELLRAAQEASRRGVPLSRLNEEIKKRTDGKFADVRSLATAARDSGVSSDSLAPAPKPTPSRPEASVGDKIGGAVRLASQGATLGFSDELGGLLAGAVHGLIPGGEGFSEARSRVTGEIRQGIEGSRQDLGLVGTAAEAGGAIAAPGGAAFRVASRAPRLIGKVLTGGLLGAGEGATYGAGAAEGSIGERLPEAGKGAAIGGLLGSAVPAAAAGAGAARAATRAARKGGRRLKEKATGLHRLDELEELEETIGPRLGDEMRQGAGVKGKPSKVRTEIREARKGIYGALDEIEEIPDEGLQKALRMEDVKPYVPDEVAAGKRAPSFPEAQGSLRQVRKAKGAAMRSGDAASVRRLAEAEREIGSRLSDAVEGFDEANQAYASHMARSRALETGGKVAPKSADEVREAFEALDSDVERQAFREALGHWYLKRLDDITAIPSTLKKFTGAPETQAKLRVLFQDEEAYESFIQAAREAEKIRNRAKAGRIAERELLRSMTKWLVGGIGLGAAGAGTASLLN
jgi:hypothetical protein